ncbi:hypothetical protein TNCV_2226691 [Trichonephila clavipes]|nr:hypothetical protein TNCV_2226691 [Trichonephila clavipes]
MIVCPKKLLPHTVTPCEIAVCRSTINAGSDRWPSVTLKLPEVGKNPVDTAYDAGSVVSVLADVGSSKPTSVSRLLMVSLDGTGCLEGGKWR